MSKYINFWVLPIIFLYVFKNNGIENYWNKMLNFTKLLINFYIIQSIIYIETTNYVHKISYELLNLILNNKYEEIINKLNECVEDKKARRLLIEKLNNDVIHDCNFYIICHLSAMLEENYKNKDIKKIKDIEKNHFSGTDIHHIQPIKDKDGNIRIEVLNEWGNDINSIGNIVLLEDNIINLNYYKEFKDKKVELKKSKLTIVKELCKYEKWEKTDCENRKKYEINKILNYLYPEKKL